MAPPITCACGECQKCKRREYMRGWYRRPGNAQAQRDSQRRSRERNLEAIRRRDRERGFRIYDEGKVRARNVLNHAVKTGRIQREPCERCGREAHAHHEDYEKPLEVIWLCPRHHGELHRAF